jgi:MIP family channel proteins
MKNLRAYTAEAVGTFALIFVGAGSIVADSYSGGAVGLVGIALAHGLVLAVMVSATMNISGGHINPAVTFGFLVTGRIRAGDALGYWIGQFTGAVLAAVCLLAAFPAVDVAATGLGTPVPAVGVTTATGVLVEGILTFFLMFVIFGTAVDPNRPRGLGGFAIGLTLGLAVLVGGPVTGASLNPARTFGPAIVSGTWAGHAIYWMGPLLGATAAAFVYGRFLLKEDTG